jgi:LmbE family N-acetylglucosaminyl deacetylase
MSEPAEVTILAIGAHPDDCDFGAAGMAALWIQAGYRVHFVSMTNGDAGHHEMGGAALARRRLAEARAAGQALGVTYTVLDNHDGELEPTLANRRTVIRLIREIRPDLVLTHRLNDYHPDHRYTALLVQDAAYMVTVPGVVAHTQYLSRNPVFGYMYDEFQRPYPLAPDVVVDIDATIALKLQMLHQHTSQMYEWLPYNGGYLDQVPPDEEARLAWLGEHYLPRFARAADRFRGLLEATYGPERGRAVRYAETVEVSEYGAPLAEEARRRLFPFLP